MQQCSDEYNNPPPPPPPIFSVRVVYHKTLPCFIVLFCSLAVFSFRVRQALFFTLRARVLLSRLLSCKLTMSFIHVRATFLGPVCVRSCFLFVANTTVTSTRASHSHCSLWEPEQILSAENRLGADRDALFKQRML